MQAVLISTYDLGRQPFGLASPAAWLRRAGAEVRCVDLTRQGLDEGFVAAADLIAFHLPMHTATRLAAPVIDRVRALNPAATLAAYGLYAPLNAGWLRERGVTQILGPEAEGELVEIAESLLSPKSQIPNPKSPSPHPNHLGMLGCGDWDLGVDQIGSAAVSTSTDSFGRRIIASRSLPAGTIGYTLSSCSTRKSITTVPSVS